MTMTGVPTAALDLPPPGLNFLSVIQPSLGVLMVGLTGSSILLTLLVILFLFSTKQLRRKPIFILNVISLILGITQGISTTFVMYRGIINPQQILTRFRYATLDCLISFVPLFVDSILLFRLLVVYPYHATPFHIFLMIFIPLMCIKVTRLANIVVFINHLFIGSGAAPNPIIAL
ncbi:hypothetical protein AMATHDRAFT_182179 [Amanita thiersii Skay4041]|uniref:Uncharacterized protein n=1 Tax=Amanita thiersii Skay4041 TaxID=703135 RepID=A0A2A9NGB4_9AGAR|nr:hypothetical protein AMATHDRAFT_182179 [Amanita thiersii Skay4041]